ncbi:MAG: ATP-binding protein [Alphaproteobacteria bacterium]|nr:ATP-binding protein [Alphaproteobacteria bacterium]MBU1513844.1 ATP-binding protein [Alphaproteobacteria bacterium]MBU2094511.1 ATP-binding protein [Alphaproteobacteria bacterium]MBU2151228.1 ATP-binding protein [Alphaproteobacteria bacterium]MBU2310043.1 ATP-binding protein [Alphaproteobacteria bacterium]
MGLRLRIAESRPSVAEIGLTLPTSLPGLESAQTLAQAIVNTIHEPLLVLDAEFHVVAASRSFYDIFKVDPAQTTGRLLYSLGDGQWDIPGLRLLLETIIPELAEMDGFEVVHDFPTIGRRTMLLNARKVIYETSPDIAILLAFTDVTDRRSLERARDLRHERTEDLLRQKQTLLQEMEHRVANSLQIIASILMIKARQVTSEETRRHLRDAHQRVMSVASVQSHLHATEGIEQIEVGSYLTKLCDSLGASMIGENQPIALRVMADQGMATSAQAVSMGLIVTELVINALKYAFPTDKAGSLVMVTYESRGEDWKLVVSDNGVGKDLDDVAETKGGLGTVIVQALVKQLDARMDVTSSASGLSVAITRASFASNMPQAA